MKKYVLLFVGLLLTGGVHATTLTEGKEYLSLERQVKEAPAVLTFFSFWCSACYQWDDVMHLTAEVEKALPSGVKLTQYHINALGPLGQEMTHAWSVAMQLGVEDKVKPLLFEAVQKKKSIASPADIRAVFIKAGVRAEDYDAAWGSFAVLSLTMKQHELANRVGLRRVPAMFINGKYQINPKGLGTPREDVFVQRYVDTVRRLVLQK